MRRNEKHKKIYVEKYKFHWQFNAFPWETNKICCQKSSFRSFQCFWLTQHFIWKFFSFQIDIKSLFTYSSCKLLCLGEAISLFQLFRVAIISARKKIWKNCVKLIVTAWNFVTIHSKNSDDVFKMKFFTVKKITYLHHHHHHRLRHRLKCPNRRHRHHHRHHRLGRVQQGRLR